VRTHFVPRHSAISQDSKERVEGLVRQGAAIVGEASRARGVVGHLGECLSSRSGHLFDRESRKA